MSIEEYLLMGKAMAASVAEGMNDPDTCLSLAIRRTLKSALRPMHKTKHYATTSKKARTRKKYQKRLDWIKGRGFDV